MPGLFLFRAGDRVDGALLTAAEIGLVHQVSRFTGSCNHFQVAHTCANGDLQLMRVDYSGVSRLASGV